MNNKGRLRAVILFDVRLTTTLQEVAFELLGHQFLVTPINWIEELSSGLINHSSNRILNLFVLVGRFNFLRLPESLYKTRIKIRNYSR